MALLLVNAPGSGTADRLRPVIIEAIGRIPSIHLTGPACRLQETSWLIVRAGRVVLIGRSESIGEYDSMRVRPVFHYRDRSSMTVSINLDEALFAAAQAGDHAKAIDALAAGANVNAANLHKVTPLLEAAGQGHLDMARYLIGQGAEVNYLGMPEGSPLMLVAFMGQVEFLRLFLGAGANPNLAMPAGGETALHMAAVASKATAAKMLLDAGADPNLHAKSGVATSMFDGGVKLWGETPLHYAAAYGDEEMIQAMLLAGADRQAPNAHGETPLEYADRHRRPRRIRNLFR